MQKQGPVWQVFGHKKCSDTRKAERFIKERGLPLQKIDLAERGPSAGELRAIAALHGMSNLLDRTGERFKSQGLAHALLTEADIERLLLAQPGLLKTPIVRCGARSTVGYAKDVWLSWLAS
ncbi:MAG TPA: ArsC/Spx/MgsR family protein [Pseudomonadota bacterium]|jgi:arsenate reductase-like glutaredoxin family protein|nr:ArsC/Spx/MgsR family protein [Pseudomonadota bacterium]